MKVSAGKTVLVGSDIAALDTAAALHTEPALDGHAPSVAALVEAASSGQEWAWQALVGRFGSLVASVGWRSGLSAADIDELQQATWLRLVEGIDRIREPEPLEQWLTTTARRESLQIRQRRDGRPTSPS